MNNSSNRIKSIKLFFKTYWLVVWITAAVLIFASSFSFAAYTNFRTAKRVVSTQKSNDVSFSSNILNNYIYANDDPNTYYTQYSKKIFVVPKENKYTAQFSVCNYPQNNIQAVSQGTINYNITAALVRKNTLEPVATGQEYLYTDKDGVKHKIKLCDDGKIQIYVYSDPTYQSGNWEDYKDEINFKINEETFNKENNYKIEFNSQQLKGGDTPKDNSYSINLENTDLIDYFDIVVTAIPCDSGSLAVSKNNILGRVLTFSVATSVVSKWKGEFTDANLYSDTTKYDAFNYTVTGQGKGMFTLSWNTDYVKISESFISQISDENHNTYEYDHTSKIHTLKFDVNDTDSNYSSIYRIQFYREAGIPDDEAYVKVSENYWSISSKDMSYVTYDFKV